MATFAYKAYTRRGDIESGEINASSPADAAGLLNARGLLPFETKALADAAEGGQSRTLFASRRSPSLRQMTEFTRALASLLDADLPIDQSLQLLSSGSVAREGKILAAELHAAIGAGVALSEAVRTHAPAAPPYAASLIMAGEARGSMGPALVELATLLERQLALRDQIRSALAYPLVLGATALAALAIVAGVLVPVLLPIFDDAGVEPPVALALVHSLSQLATTHGYALLSGAILLLVTAWRLARRPAIRLWLDACVLRLPVLGDLARQATMASMARALGALLRGGVPLVSALSLASGVSSNAVMSTALARAAEHVKEGARLADALARSGHFVPVVLNFVAVGEETGRLDQMLLHLADMLDSDTRRRIDRLMTLLAPMLTVVIGIAVGGLILSVMQAILSVNELVLR